jgi:hypothetical protein
MLYEGQNERVEELNRAIYARNAADTPLEPMFDFRPVQTKYALFPALDRRTITELQPPSQNQSPGFQVDKETQLQNRFFALQKGGSEIQSAYIPSTDSMLYKDPEFSKKAVPTEHAGLFQSFQRPDPKPVPHFISSLHMTSRPFGNATRTQMRVDVTEEATKY